jgi:hypothetical protein
MISELALIWTVVSGVIAATVGGLLWQWKRDSAIYKAINETTLGLKDLELKVAQEYVGIKAMESLRAELKQSIDHLGSRLETALRDWYTVFSSKEKK